MQTPPDLVVSVPPLTVADKEAVVMDADDLAYFAAEQITRFLTELDAAALRLPLAYGPDLATIRLNATTARRLMQGCGRRLKQITGTEASKQ